ncbi:uncharacterized protein LOC142546084 [Primulina tabacum]|uniref:uncharacterized protein LOC142546084 n=1 Tax=Primulina tabacum TaxID=48773 RepID=UPI003F59FF72
MECWVPFFDFSIFLNSPGPETETSTWLQKSFNPSSNTTSISTSSFISLLMKPAEVNFSVSSTPNREKRVMWIQTLPDLVQARVLLFLAYDYQRLCNKDLCRIARIMSVEGKYLYFWVKKAEEKLLDLVSVSNYRWLSDLNLDSEEEHVENECQSVPDSLRERKRDLDEVAEELMWREWPLMSLYMLFLRMWQNRCR